MSTSDDGHSKRRRGLSWLHFWLAIAAVVLLAAIIFPMFAHTGHPSWKSMCLDNLKELGECLQMYSHDYDGKLPVALGSDDKSFETTRGRLGASGRPMTWTCAVYPYSNKENYLFWCPSDGDQSDSPSAELSYHYRHAVHLAAKADIPLRSFCRLEAQVILYEHMSYHWGCYPLADGKPANVAFLDGHVRTVRMANVGPDGEPNYFNAVVPGAPLSAKQTPPHWDPRYCYDRLSP